VIIPPLSFPSPLGPQVQCSRDVDGHLASGDHLTLLATASALILTPDQVVL
jgi:hypothetical protein